MYSRQTGSGESLVSWEPKDLGDRAVIDSEVGVASLDPSTMDFGSDPTAYSVSRFKTSVTNLTNSVPDISGEVAAKSSAPTAPIAPIGTSTLASGDYFQNGDISVDGDLILDGTNLYIDGSLRVNGSITGDGAVYVNGETSFFGDSRITTNSEHSVALYSKGSVKLSGFNGTEFIENSVAADPQAQSWWDQTKATIADLDVLLATSTPADLMGDTGSGAQPSRDLEKMRWTLSDYQADWADTTWQGRDKALVPQLMSYLENQPDSLAKTHVLNRLDELERLFSIDRGSPYNPGGTTRAAIAQNWLTGDRSLYGILDAVASHGTPELMGELSTLAQRYDYNRLGSSFFRGVIFTNGFLYSTNEVHVIGSVHAHDDGSQNPEFIDGKELKPGDMFFDANTSLTYNQDFSDNAGLSGGGGHLRAQTWIER